MSAPVTAIVAARNDVHKSCKTLEGVVNVLNDYCEAATATAAIQKKLAKALREAATTRKFYKGRTEAIRVVSSESDAWVRSMNDESVEVGERRKLFGEAVKRHGRDARMAGSGLGVDRHLLGESCLGQSEACVWRADG